MIGSHLYNSQILPAQAFSTNVRYVGLVHNAALPDGALAGSE